MKPKHIKKLLMSEIETVANASDEYCLNPGRNFSRKRKLSFKKVVESIIGMGSKGLTNELIDIFNNAPDMPSASAFVQQRNIWHCKKWLINQTSVRPWSLQTGDMNLITTWRIYRKKDGSF